MTAISSFTILSRLHPSKCSVLLCFAERVALLSSSPPPSKAFNMSICCMLVSKYDRTGIGRLSFHMVALRTELE